MSAGGPVAAAILSAGRSSRMGRPKALLPGADGRTFLEAVVGRAREAGLDPVRVVLGAHRQPILRALPALAPDVVSNEQVELGQLHSLRLALASLPGSTAACVMFLVDHPLVAAGTVEQLVATWRRERSAAVVPAFGGRRGHPVLLDRRLFGPLCDGSLDGGARAVLRAHADEVAEVAVDDSGVLHDVDTPEDYEERFGVRP